MARHGFGRGEYKYFGYPLPDARRATCAAPSTRTSRPSPTAGTRRWASTSAIRPSTPTSSRAAMRPGSAADAAAAAVRPRRLQLPAPGSLRRACVSAAGRDPAVRAGPRFHRRRVRADRAAAAHAVAAEVVPLRQGDAVVFAVHHRPVQGTRGVYRVNLRHGVSRLLSGQRHTIGIIFHDAR